MRENRRHFRTEDKVTRGRGVRIHGGARRGARDYGTGTRVHRWLWRWVVRAESTDRSTLARVEVGRARTAPPFRAPRNNTPSARTRRARHWPSSTPDLPQETLADYRPVALLPSLPNSFQNRQNLQGISLSIGGCPHLCSHKKMWRSSFVIPYSARHLLSVHKQLTGDHAIG